MQTQGVAATGQSYIHIVYNREIQSWLTGSFCDFHQVSRYVSYRDSSIAIRIVSWGYRIVTPLVSNQSIRERTKQPTASSLLRQCRLSWFGHLHRMPSSLPVRRVFDFNPNIHGWKRPRGHPKTRWADSIKHDLNSAGLDTINAAQMVYDRPQWKAFVCGLPMLEPEHGP